MKTIGLIGGMSWESSAEYYRIINQTVKQRLGGLHSADCLLYSFDFAEIEALQMRGDWNTAADLLIEGARRVQRGGAQCLVLCTNTMHKLAPAIQAAVNLPLIHIADPTAAVIRAQGLSRIGLLGTRFTMEEPFYRDRLRDIHGIEVLIPNETGRETIHRIIYDELVRGDIRPDSRSAYVDVIHELSAQGAEGIILGCTEIGLLIKPEHSPLPVFDTTYLHAVAAVDFALMD
jgi:aspartate racemase